MHGVSFKDSNATFELKNYFGEATCVLSFKFYYDTYSQNIYPNKCEDVATLNQENVHMFWLVTPAYNKICSPSVTAIVTPVILLQICKATMPRSCVTWCGIVWDSRNLFL